MAKPHAGICAGGGWQQPSLPRRDDDPVVLGPRVLFVRPKANAKFGTERDLNGIVCVQPDNGGGAPDEQAAAVPGYELAFR